MDSLVFLDTETTGLNGSRDRIIEIYMLRVHKHGKAEEFESFINPLRPIPTFITEITGITDTDVHNAPDEQEIAKPIREFIGEGTIVAHNLPFDKRFLDAMFKRNNCVPLGKGGIDTLALSRQLFPKLCIYPKGEGSHKLKNLMYHFGLDKQFSNSHRAKDDVLLLVQVYRSLQKYAAGELDYTFPDPVCYGCPSCGSPMRVWEGDTYRELICSKHPACQERLVV